jgi:hypothetical protein
LKISSTALKLSGPLTLIIEIAPIPGGVAIAIIVSSFKVYPKIKGCKISYFQTNKQK